MILVDANVILYAEDSLSIHHRRAVEWWDEQLSGSSPVGLCWPVLTAFLRISTNRRLHRRPLTILEATGKVNSWLAQPCVRIVESGPSHWPILRRLLEETGATANLVSDAHLAALAIGYGALLCSSDQDFARFQGLRWIDPLKGKQSK
jgi:toxin-antitoxin system PIN domain toxin